MILVGLALLIAAAFFAAMGISGCLAARRSASKSRYAAVTLFGHGALASSGGMAVLALLHFHSPSPFSLHVHAASEALSEVLNCDLEASCAAVTVLLVVGTVLLASFGVSQASARLLLRKYRALQVPARSAALLRHGALSEGTRLLVVRDEEADAFSFAILRWGGRRIFRGEDVIVMTTGLLDLLTEGEASAVLAHEAAHVEARDDRYLPFFHVLSMLLFFDPALRLLRRRVGRHHEFAADAESARVTRRPLDLARALLKVYLKGMPAARATGLFGRGSRAEMVQRIEALLALDAAGLGRDVGYSM
jgi:Zn-dependent protease with chaperone function